MKQKELNKTFMIISNCLHDSNKNDSALQGLNWPQVVAELDSAVSSYVWSAFQLV